MYIRGGGEEEGEGRGGEEEKGRGGEEMRSKSVEGERRCTDYDPQCCSRLFDLLWMRREEVRRRRRRRREKEEEIEKGEGDEDEADYMLSNFPTCLSGL